MPRPIRPRCVRGMPKSGLFKPAGIPASSLQETVLKVEEYECIRLVDFEGMSQIEAANRMGVSQPTFQRIYSSARKKIATAIVEGMALKIDGGDYRLMGTGRQHRFRGI